MKELLERLSFIDTNREISYPVDKQFVKDTEWKAFDVCTTKAQLNENTFLLGELGYNIKVEEHDSFGPLCCSVYLPLSKTKIYFG